MKSAGKNYSIILNMEWEKGNGGTRSFRQIPSSGEESSDALHPRLCLVITGKKPAQHLALRSLKS
jgi:hypothetical protein